MVVLSFFNYARDKINVELSISSHEVRHDIGRGIDPCIPFQTSLLGHPPQVHLHRLKLEACQTLITKFTFSFIAHAWLFDVELIIQMLSTIHEQYSYKLNSVTQYSVVSVEIVLA